MRLPTAGHGAAWWLEGARPQRALSSAAEGCALAQVRNPALCERLHPMLVCRGDPTPGRKVAAGGWGGPGDGQGPEPWSCLAWLLGSLCSRHPVLSIRGDALLAASSEKFGGRLPSAAQGFISYFLNEVGNPSGPRSVQSLLLRGSWKRKRWRESVAQLFPPPCQITTFLQGGFWILGWFCLSLFNYYCSCCVFIFFIFFCEPRLPVTITSFTPNTVTQLLA